jgi:peptidoglycan L-alanyl-D-glutamate endopeptidase CwlK
MYDPTPAVLASLTPRIARIADEFISELRRQGLPLIATSGLRSLQQQRTLLQQRRTSTLQSRHLDGLAFDVDVYGVDRNRVPAWIWSQIGPFGESFGLTWGGRWHTFRDVGHFEL